LPSSHITALEIGLITFAICGIALMSSTFLKSLPHQWLLRFAAIIFFALGGRILLNYL
jgi:putative Mn2+ efflux pump MntP